MTSPINVRGTDTESLVVGPASATDNAVARFDGTTGKLLQNSGVVIDDSNNVTGVANLDVGNADTTLARAAAGRVTVEAVAIVRGPGSATDNAVVRFDATTGDLTQNSAFVVDDSGHVTSFGGNIAFPATQVSSAGANVLDDYQEETWTPTFTAATPPTSVTYTTRVGYAQKVGAGVTAWFNVTLSSKGTGGVGGVILSGLPYTAQNVAGYNARGALDTSVQTWGAGQTAVTCAVLANATNVIFLEYGSNTALTNPTWANANNTSGYNGSLPYLATA